MKFQCIGAQLLIFDLDRQFDLIDDDRSSVTWMPECRLFCPDAVLVVSMAHNRT